MPELGASALILLGVYIGIHSGTQPSAYKMRHDRCFIVDLI